jgi:hypothetical protein
LSPINAWITPWILEEKLSSLERNLLHWFIKYPRLRCIPFLVSWRIWKYMNKIMFENGQREESRIISRILMDIKEFKDIGEDDKVDTILNPVYFDEKPIGFFDGATVNDKCGIGIFLKLCAQHVYKAYFAGGKGNNMKA